MNANKKILSLLLILVLLAGWPLSADAAADRIDGISEKRTLEDLYSLGQSGDPWDIRLYSGDEIRIPLTADMFTWSSGRTPVNMERVTTQQLKGGRVKLRARRISGSVTLDFLQFDTDVFDGRPFLTPGLARTGRTAQISVILTREFASTEELDFEYELYMSVDGQRYEELEITLSGTLLVHEELVDESADYINMEDGVVVEAAEYVPNIRMDLGKGLSVDASLFKDRRYYGTCEIVESRFEMKEGLDGELAELPDLYPEIALIYKLNTVNIGPGGTARTRVSIHVPEDDTVYHVYSEDLRYLGTTSDRLAFSEMYILCTQPVPQMEEIEYDNFSQEGETAAEQGEEEAQEALVYEFEFNDEISLSNENEDG